MRTRALAVQGGMRLKASLLRRGEALLSNASASPSNCVGVRVGESMRVSDAVERWHNARTTLLTKLFLRVGFNRVIGFHHFTKFRYSTLSNF